MMKKVAVIQHSPSLLNRQSSIQRAVEFITEAAASGASLIVFPEAFLPGYPAWIWRLRPGSDWTIVEQLHQRLLTNAVELQSDQLKPVLSATRDSNTTVVIGINERDTTMSRSTLYNTVLTIDSDGQIVNRHRKLMPTNPERTVWGFGDASGLRVVDTPIGRIGCLLCWENYMPLARYALYAQGVEVYIAPTYDSGEAWLGTMQHIAREGGCWVICAGVALRNRDIPADLPERHSLYPASEDWINQGDSMIVAPGGDILSGPLREQQDILYAEIDASKAAISRRTFDVAGHYSRPDIFTLHIDRREQSPVSFD